MKTIQIKNRFTKEVIYETKAKSLKEAVEKAIKEKVDLSEANLSEADLFEADLSEANLSKANLSKADLSKADLLFCRMDKTVFKQIIENWFEWQVKEK